MRWKTLITATMAAMIIFSCGVSAEEAGSAESQNAPIAKYDTEDGLIEFIDYAINDDDIAIVVDYTNTTDEDVTPEMQIGIKVFQDGIEMDRGSHFEIEGVRDGYSEIRPGTKIRVAEFFELENQNPIEIEFYQIFSFDAKEPLYVEVNLDSNKITSKSGDELGIGGKIFGGIFGKAYSDFMGEYEKAYDEVMDEYKDAYNEAMDAYQDAYDDTMSAYNEAMDEVMGGFGF